MLKKNKIKKFSCFVILISPLGLLSCGSNSAKSPLRNSEQSAASAGAKEVKATGDNTGVSSNLLDMDPSKMNDAELDRFIEQLKQRNAAEIDEQFFLQAFNKELCLRLQKLRQECVATNRLIADGSEKALGCDGTFGTTTAFSNKFSTTIAGGPFTLQANSTYTTASLANGKTDDVKFTTTADASVKAPKFMDLTSLRLVSSAATLPALTAIDFNFVVGEITLFTKADLIAAEDASAKYYRVNPAKILELKNNAACTVSIEDINKIKQDVLARAKK